MEYVYREDLGWASVGHAHFRVIPVKGSHMNFLQEDSVSFLAEEMNEVMDKSEAGLALKRPVD